MKSFNFDGCILLAVIKYINTAGNKYLVNFIKLVIFICLFFVAWKFLLFKDNKKPQLSVVAWCL